MLYAVLMYPLAYFYLRGVMFPQSYPDWGMPVFAALFIVYVDCAARAAHCTAAKETPLWAVCWMALAVAYPLYGYQPGPLGDWQWMVWHLFAVWYVLARCGMLAQGQSGSLAPLDALAGFVLLPFGNFFLRARTVFAALRTRLQDRTRTRKVLRLIVTAAVTLALCGVAWSRLLNNVRFIDQLMYILLSLPVGAWLYGLVGGSLRRKAPPTTAQQCAAVLENCRIVPRTTAVAAVTALCGVYALFFAVQAGEWLAAAPLGLDAPDTAAFAVNGFWELLKILLLNFAVLAGIQFFGRAPLPKALAAVFCGFGVAFAALAAGKLAVYVTLCALTPRRFTAAWCLFVLAVCAVLALVRVFKPIPAAKLAIFAAAVSFTLLCCVNVKQRVIDVNLARYEAGIDEELDWGVLWECGYQENEAR